MRNVSRGSRPELPAHAARQPAARQPPLQILPQSGTASAGTLGALSTVCSRRDETLSEIGPIAPLPVPRTTRRARRAAGDLPPFPDRMLRAIFGQAPDKLAPAWLAFTHGRPITSPQRPGPYHNMPQHVISSPSRSERLSMLRIDAATPILAPHEYRPRRLQRFVAAVRRPYRRCCRSSGGAPSSSISSLPRRASALNRKKVVWHGARWAGIPLRPPAGLSRSFPPALREGRPEFRLLAASSFRPLVQPLGHPSSRRAAATASLNRQAGARPRTQAGHPALAS